MEKPSLDTAKAGAMRFNTDSSQMEIYDGNQWTGILATSPELQTGGTRMLVMGGIKGGSGPRSNSIDAIQMSSTGSATDFGDLLSDIFAASSCSSRVVAFRMGGGTPTQRNDIGKSIFASQGNEVDTGGDLSTSWTYSNGLSDSTRGIITAGYTASNVNIIEHFSMINTGNTNDFGDLTSVRFAPATFASPTRGIIAGGSNPSNPTGVATIEFITISTLGNSADFGDISDARSQAMGSSNAVRGLIAGGGDTSGGGGVNTIEFVTTTSLGNAADFGDLTYTSNRDGASGASATRSILSAGGDPFASPYGKVNNIDYGEIMSTGNAIDFGDLTESKNHMEGSTNGHGGL